VDPICARGALRDEVVSVASSGRGEPSAPPRAVAREQVRANCLDAEDGRDQDVRVAYLRYDTAIKTQVDVDGDAGRSRMRTTMVRGRSAAARRRGSSTG